MMCEATYALNREDRLFRGTLGRVLAQKWPRRESSRREEHLSLFCHSLSPSQSPVNSFLGWFCKWCWSQADSFSRTLKCPRFTLLSVQSLNFVLHSNKQMKNPIALNQLGILSDKCLECKDSRQYH